MKRELPDWSLGSRRYSCLVFSLSVGSTLATVANAVRKVKKLVNMLIWSVWEWSCFKDVVFQTRLSCGCDDDKETVHIEEVVMSLSYSYQD